MIKRIIVTIFILCLTNLSTIAECVTGYACSIKDLQEKQINQENSLQEKPNIVNQDIEKNKVKTDNQNILNNKEKEIKKVKNLD